MRVFVSHILSAGLLLLSPTVARAEAPLSADEVLRRVDHQNNAFKDAIFHFKMRVKDPSGRVTEAEFVTKQKGQKRLVRFLQPADWKGMGILVESPEVMYAMLPAFGNRIRRLGMHQKNQSFMGSDVSNDDMSATELGPLYVPKLAGQEGGSLVLELVARPGKQPEFSRAKLWVDPQKSYITLRIEYYDAAGKNLRSQVRSDFFPDPPGSDHFSPRKILFTDHRRNDHQTELLLQEDSKVNTGLADDEFTQRALQRN